MQRIRGGLDVWPGRRWHIPESKLVVRLNVVAILLRSIALLTVAGLHMLLAGSWYVLEPKLIVWYCVVAILLRNIALLSRGGLGM